MDEFNNSYYKVMLLSFVKVKMTKKKKNQIEENIKYATCECDNLSFFL